MVQATSSSRRHPIVALALLAASGSAVVTLPETARGQAPHEPRGAAIPSEAAYASLVELFERSEAGDINAPRTTLASADDPDIRAIIEVRLAASRLNLPAVRAAMRRVRERGVAPKWRAIAIATEAGAAFACGDYSLAASDGAVWLQLPDGTDPIHTRSDILQLQAIAAQLAQMQRQSVIRRHSSSSPAWRDKATLVRTMVTIDGRRQEVVLDTGANVSVLTETTARMLGLEIVDGASVRSSSRAAVPVRLAMSRRLEIAGTSLRNVAFLVLKDSDLRLPLPGGYEIPAIIGFPVLRAMGRVGFTPTSFFGGRRAGPSARGTPMVASGSDLYVITRVNGIEVTLHLDSGASSTTLGSRFAADHPAFTANLGRRATRSAGAGGAVEGTASVLRNATVEVGGVRAKVPAIDVITATGDAPGNYGTLGQDVLRAASGYTIDFAKMTITLDRAAAPAARLP